MRGKRAILGTGLREVAGRDRWSSGGPAEEGISAGGRGEPKKSRQIRVFSLEWPTVAADACEVLSDWNASGNGIVGDKREANRLGPQPVLSVGIRGRPKKVPTSACGSIGTRLIDGVVSGDQPNPRCGLPCRPQGPGAALVEVSIGSEIKTRTQ